MTDGRSFPVSMPPSTASRLAVNTEMLLKLESEHLTLVSHGGIHSWTWNIEHLRNYGYKREDFHFEAGSRCQTGEGHFVFYTVQGKEIVKQLNKMKDDYKKRKCLQSKSLPERPRKQVVKKKKLRPRKLTLKFKSLSLLPGKKPRGRKRDRFLLEESREEEAGGTDNVTEEESVDVPAAYVTILPQRPSALASESTRQKTRSRRAHGDAWKHHGY
ncbi:docking protein 2 [Penaeus vannamei]|uniref:docking protein 2 n=1 Tax=Penaeus vannamei TaxID=6689 RepID=UPI000F68C212|nr:docking protein 2-like [Penaeus vannamei]